MTILKTLPRRGCGALVVSFAMVMSHSSAIADDAVVTKGDLPGSFKLPGTNTSLRIGGFAYLEAIKDFNGGGQGGTVGLVQSIPLGGSPAASRGGQFTLTARRSRLHLSSLTPTSMGEVKTYIEGDFYGAGGSEIATNSAAFRLRLAYAEIGPWTIGQAYTTFTDQRSSPEILDFSGGHGVPLGARQPLIRYVAKSGAHEFAFAIENPENDFVGVVTPTLTAGVGPVNTNSVDRWPDLVAKYAVGPSWGRFAISGVARRLTLNNVGGAAINGFVGESSVTTTGMMINGKVLTGGEDALTFAMFRGNGIGRYVLGLPGSTAAVVNNGGLETIAARGGNISFRHYWAPGLRSNISYALVKTSNPHPALPLSAISKVDAFYLNTIWNATPAASFGVEFVRGRVRNDAAPTPALSNKGSSDRLSMTAQYAF